MSLKWNPFQRVIQNALLVKAHLQARLCVLWAPEMEMHPKDV